MNKKAFPVIDLGATGRNITALRKARGLSVSDLQEYFGFEAPQAIYKWQKGQSLPSTDNLYALSFLLGVSIEAILVPIQPQHRMLPQDQNPAAAVVSGRQRSMAATFFMRPVSSLFLSPEENKHSRRDTDDDDPANQDPGHGVLNADRVWS